MSSSAYIICHEVTRWEETGNLVKFTSKRFRDSPCAIVRLAPFTRDSWNLFDIILRTFLARALTDLSRKLAHVARYASIALNDSLDVMENTSRMQSAHWRYLSGAKSSTWQRLVLEAAPGSFEGEFNLFSSCTITKKESST